MEWKKCDNSTFSLKEGTIARTKDGEFVMVGKINCSLGVNDEFMEDITHYSESLVPEISNFLKLAEINFNKIGGK